jgi:MraZ protein
MTTFIGDYICKLDSKGRVLIPAAFQKQMPLAAKDKFVIKKDVYEPCLVFFPMDEWERQNEMIKLNTNPYNREHARFLREYYKDTAEVEMDSSSRILVPARLLKLAQVDKEVVLAGQLDKIELWSPELYNASSASPDDFAELASRILGGSQNPQS